jgi:hypothetical protein
MDTTTSSGPSREGADHDLPLQEILDALRGLRFGSITIIVQDGVIVQVERIEKKRLARSPRRPAQS